MKKNKKKVNPHNRPVDMKTINMSSILTEVTEDNVLVGWLLFLGSLSYYYETTASDIDTIWLTVNGFSDEFARNGTLDDKLKFVEEKVGLKMPYNNITTANVKTEGQLRVLYHKARKNAIYAAFSLFAYPLLKEDLLELDKAKEIFARAYELEDDVQAKRISYRDLQWVLVNEYGRYVHRTENGVTMDVVDKSFELPEKFA